MALYSCCVLSFAFAIGCGGGKESAKTDKSNDPQKKGKSNIKVATPSNARGSFDASPDLNWKEVTSKSGVEWTYRNGKEHEVTSILESLGGGVGLLDFDRDGLQDAFIPGGGSFKDATTKDPKIIGLPSALYHNLGNMKFASVGEASNVADSSLYSHGAQVGDFDNDGFPDVVVTGYGGVRLYHNLGDGTFEEVHQEAKLLTETWSSSAGWADFNKDGILDLYLCAYVDWSFSNHPFCAAQNKREICAPKRFRPLPDVLYLGSEDGTFKDVSAAVGLVGLMDRNGDCGKGLGVTLGDIDRDGDVDIYVANDTVDNFLYLNDGKGNFKEVALSQSVAVDSIGVPNGSMGVDLGDYNGDLKPDIWVANFEEEAFALYERISFGFRHASDKTGITSIGGLFVGFGTSFLDADRDGDEDIIVANGHVILYPSSGQVLQPPLMLVNENRKRYVRRLFEDENYFSTRHAGRGLAVGDLDLDGRLDLVVSNNEEPVAVIQNQSKDKNQWLRVRLVGKKCRDAIGAAIVLKTDDDDQQLRMVKGGSSYLSQNEDCSFWGVPAGKKFKSLTITWPSGKEEVIDNLALNQTHVILE